MSSTKRHNPWIVISMFVVVVIIFFMRHWLALATYALGKPIWNAKQAVTQNLDMAAANSLSKKAMFASLLEQQDYITSLEQSVLALETQINRYERISSLVQDSSQVDVVANIVARPSEKAPDIFIIDKGTNHGLTEGAKVYAAGSVLLGDISAVYPEAAVVSLYSKKGRQSLGILEESGFSTPIFGRGGHTMELHIPRQIEVITGERITVAGDPNHIVGLVEGLEFDDRDPFQKVFVNFPVRLDTLREVGVSIDG